MWKKKELRESKKKSASGKNAEFQISDATPLGFPHVPPSLQPLLFFSFFNIAFWTTSPALIDQLSAFSFAFLFKPLLFGKPYKPFSVPEWEQFREPKSFVHGLISASCLSTL